VRGCLVLTVKSDFGQIIWLTEDELQSEVVMLEIERMKGMGRVAVFCSGRLEPKQVIEKLVTENYKQ
jgi:hypothetical protein